MKKNGKLIVLSDNIVFGRKEFLAESGLSLYLETKKHRYLFDVGFGRTLVHNAAILGIDLSELDGIFLSHSHSDHTGGLSEVMKYISRIPVYAHPMIFANRYRINNENIKNYGGIPFVKNYIEKLGADFYLTQGITQPEKRVYFTGEIPRIHEFEKADLDGRYVETEEGVTSDEIQDEQALAITAKEGLILITGCAHSGLLNTLSHAMEITGAKHVHCLIGGTHLGFAEENQIEKTITKLKEFDIEKIITGHCTGVEVATRLRHEFPDSFEFSYVGKQLKFTI